MKPPPFAYVAPDTVDGVVAALVDAGEDAKILAGGQSLLPPARPAAGPTERARRHRSGARPRHGHGRRRRPGARRADHPRPARARSGGGAAGLPLLAEVAPLVAHAAVRNRGTPRRLAGPQRPRRRVAGGGPAAGRVGDRGRAPAGARTIAAADLFESYLTTALGPDEVLTEVRMPGAPARTGHAFDEVSRRHGDFALVGAGARVTLDDAGLVTTAASCSSGSTARPCSTSSPGSTSPGGRRRPRRSTRSARAAAGRLDPHDDLHATGAYRRRLAATLARRTLVTAAGRAAAEGHS